MIEQIKQALEKVSDGGAWVVTEPEVRRDYYSVMSHYDEIATVHLVEDAKVIAKAPEWLRYLVGEVERLKLEAEFRSVEYNVQQEKENMELRKALETISSIKYDNLGYSPEDAQCMNDIARQVLEKVKP